MHLQLSEETEELVMNQIRSGRFQSADEVVREAMRRLDREQASGNFGPGQLAAHLDQGLCELDRGDAVDGEVLLRAWIRELDRAIAES